MRELILGVAIVILVVLKGIEKLVEGKFIYDLLDKVDRLSGEKIFPDAQEFQNGNDVSMNQMHHDMFMQQAQHADEMARMAATGIEFGGTNCDPNLNPGMSSMMDHGMHNMF